jgi:hypothetical protein
MNYEQAKQNWINGLWDKNALKRAYACGIIAKEQYKEIVTSPQHGG